MPRIHIITTTENLLNLSYLISKMAKRWQQAGIEITIGPVDILDASIDLAILHVDQTFVSENLLPKNPHNIRILNGNLLDISKRRFSKLAVQQNEKWKGPVIIKSNYNCFGEQERKLQRKSRLWRYREKLSKRSWNLARMLPPATYPVLDSRDDIPSWVWRNQNLLVERFLPEKEEGLNVVRGWIFFGNKQYHYKLFSKDKIIKARSALDFTFIDEPPPSELLEYRKANSIDFGKIDFVLHEAEAFIIDVNKTPTVISRDKSPQIDVLATGLHDFLKS